eukprot:CAMPEP_0171169780 /NCGR_PEP_ID=MMETSP0790-20130122/8384_1 /TAXON_ID=2925 /ORGANISM="Alexandrium catenella, Strain OF101" /LENGTH=270 /DNA_ID=CAMNT_0011634625 /DNA_START=71 /DNA_END=879 /DNA_ORIENTATION=+
MARLAAAALALLSSSSQALVHSQKEGTLDCMCKDWADVYKPENGHNLTCGMGMELFYVMDRMNLGIDTNVRHKVALGKSSHALARTVLASATLNASPPHSSARMARFAAAALALLSSPSQALIHSQRESTLDCMCMDWSDVYKAENGHNVTCGMGMELFYVMERMNLGIDTNVRHKVALGKSTHATASALEQLKGTMAYNRFCTDFFMRSQFNYCVNKRFLMEQHQVKSSKGTWCYVSSKCTLPYILTAVPGTDLAVKQCSEVMDVSLGT